MTEDFKKLISRMLAKDPSQRYFFISIEINIFSFAKDLQLNK